MFLIAKGYYALLEWLYKVEKPCEKLGLKWLWYEYTCIIYNTTADLLALASR